MDDGDDVNEFLEQKRPRKKKKKGKNAGDEGPREVNWDDFYDLREWTNLDQWKTSVARIRKHNEWKDYLKSHARGSKERRSSYSSDGSSPPRRPMPSKYYLTSLVTKSYIIQVHSLLLLECHLRLRRALTGHS